jgi:hypothetical protein
MRGDGGKVALHNPPHSAARTGTCKSNLAGVAAAALSGRCTYDGAPEFRAEPNIMNPRPDWSPPRAGASPTVEIESLESAPERRTHVRIRTSRTPFPIALQWTNYCNHRAACVVVLAARGIGSRCTVYTTDRLLLVPPPPPL